MISLNPSNKVVTDEKVFNYLQKNYQNYLELAEQEDTFFDAYGIKAEIGNDIDVVKQNKTIDPEELNSNNTAVKREIEKYDSFAFKRFNKYRTYELSGDVDLDQDFNHVDKRPFYIFKWTWTENIGR